MRITSHAWAKEEFVASLAHNTDRSLIAQNATDPATRFRTSAQLAATWSEFPTLEQLVLSDLTMHAMAPFADS